MQMPGNGYLFPGILMPENIVVLVLLNSRISGSSPNLSLKIIKCSFW